MNKTFIEQFVIIDAENYIKQRIINIVKNENKFILNEINKSDILNKEYLIYLYGYAKLIVNTLTLL